MRSKDAKILLEAIDKGYNKRRSGFRIFRPNKFEQEFLHNIKKEVEAKDRISDAQGKVLQNIYCKAHEME